MEQFDLAQLAGLSVGFSGAEIEQAVVSALYDAFAEQKDLAERHVERAVQETVPLATTMREDVERVREWARTRTRPASTAPAEAVPKPLATRFG